MASEKEKTPNSRRKKKHPKPPRTIVKLKDLKKLRDQRWNMKRRRMLTIEKAAAIEARDFQAIADKAVAEKAPAAMQFFTEMDAANAKITWLKALSDAIEATMETRTMPGTFPDSDLEDSELSESGEEGEPVAKKRKIESALLPNASSGQRCTEGSGVVRLRREKSHLRPKRKTSREVQRAVKSKPPGHFSSSPTPISSNVPNKRPRNRATKENAFTPEITDQRDPTPWLARYNI